MENSKVIISDSLVADVRNIIEKPNYFRDAKDFYHYQLSTKAKEWAHEQEVRLFILDPSAIYMKLMPGQNDDNGPIDWKEMRAYFEIGSECFESVYIGTNMKADEKSKIIKAARIANPEIKIYQMEIDPKVFKLNAKLIQ